MYIQDITKREALDMIEDIINYSDLSYSKTLDLIQGFLNGSVSVEEARTTYMNGEDE